MVEFVYHLAIHFCFVPFGFFSCCCSIELLQPCFGTLTCFLVFHLISSIFPIVSFIIFYYFYIFEVVLLGLIAWILRLFMFI